MGHKRPSRAILKTCKCGKKFYPKSSEDSCNIECYLKDRYIISDEGCWLMQVGIRESGYSRILFGKQRIQAHELTYQLHVGKLPEGAKIVHICKNKHCCNPQHLKLDENPLKTYIKTHSNINENGCWVWTGCITNSGYAKASYSRMAHRLSYEAFKGNIEKDKCVCHSCDNRLCVNPDHLWLGTHKENMQDKVSKGRSPDRHGEKHPRAKLSNEKIIEIRKLAENGEKTTNIAKKFCVSPGLISGMKNKTRWGNV